MRRLLWPFSIFLVLIIYFLPDSPKASEEKLDDRKAVFQFLELAFQAQISLSEKDRTMEEVELILDPYFSKEYQKKFLDENLVEEDGKFFTYGTDFGYMFIPFFNFSDFTKLVFKDDQIYVFEYFPESKLGPVGYESHYEGLLISRVNQQWKITDYLINEIPKDIILQAIN
jgi:hypothetical protein